MAVLAGVSFVMGVVFVSIGAWPVFGFLGLDIAIVYLAFKLNYRAAQATETVEVTRDDLTITRHSASGRQQSVTRLSPTWARLLEHDAPDGSLTLYLSLHGRRYTLARHLNSDERRGFARALRAALHLVREPERS